MKELLPLVSNVPAIQALNKYLDERIETVKRDFMNADTMEQVRATQATVHELERLKKLRDSYMAEGNRNG